MFNTLYRVTVTLLLIGLVIALAALPFVLNYYAVTMWYTGAISWWLGVLGMVVATLLQTIPLYLRAERSESFICAAIERFAEEA